jgi:uncharacterized Zn finger protein (UPF0148 family)
MGRRMTCPACGSRTSSILRAFEDGESCPSCGLPYTALAAVIDIKAREANDEVTQRAVRAELRAAAAEDELHTLRRVVEAVRSAVNRPPDRWDGRTEPFAAPEHPAILDDDAEVESFLPDQG